MSLYQRKGTPFWWYDFTLDGLRFRGSTGKTSKREAGRVEDDHKQAARKQARTATVWKVHDLCTRYYDEHAKDKASAETILHQLGKLEDYLGKDRKLMSLSNASLMDYRAKRRGDGLQGHSINREIVILRAAMTYANKMHDVQVPNLRWDSLRTQEPPNRTRFLSFDEYDALFTAAHKSLKPILICAVTTGLRKGNILRLDWAQVKLGERIIQMVVKGGKPHGVRIVPDLLAALSTTAPESRKGRVFDTTNFEKRWRQAIKDSGLADLRFHDLRHTFASWARQNGADIADVFDALGHSDISMTMRYAHIKPDSAQTAFDKVSAAITAHRASQRLQKGRI